MKKHSIYFVIVMTAIGLTSCNRKQMVTTKSGMKYTLIETGNEEIPPGSMILLSFVAKDANDSIWMDSRLDQMPRPARKPDSISTLNQGGIEEVIFHMKKGDSVSCEVPIEKIYGNRTLPTGMEKEDLLTIDLKIEDAMDENAFQKYSQDMMIKQREISEQKAKEQLVTDIEKIDAYLSENNISAQKTESGLRYVITKEGKGEKVQHGQKIKANYIGRLLNGAFFDSNIEQIAKENGLYDERRAYGPFQTAIGEGAVIKGWDEGFQLMNQGSEATLYIPSGLAYGPRERSAEIPANAILVFEIELLEIIAE